MSARTEQLLSEISELEAKIAAEPAGSRNTVMLREQLLSRRKELTAATQALTEGKQILKG
jgi:hypothetical protein